VHIAIRVLLWLAVALLVYRKAPFHSRGYRFTFAISVVVAGSLLDLALDHLLFQGEMFRGSGRWGC